MDGIEDSQDLHSPGATKDAIHRSGHRQHSTPTVVMVPPPLSSAPVGARNPERETKRRKTADQQLARASREPVERQIVNAKVPRTNDHHTEQHSEMPMVQPMEELGDRPRSESPGLFMTDDEAPSTGSDATITILLIKKHGQNVVPGAVKRAESFPDNPLRNSTSILSNPPELKRKRSTSPIFVNQNEDLTVRSDRRPEHFPSSPEERIRSTLVIDTDLFRDLDHILNSAPQRMLDHIDEISQNCGFKKKELDQLRDNLRKTGSPKKRMVSNWVVGLLGEAGSGKSTLMNNSLETPGAAATDCGGTSCTHVVHEFVHTELGQGAQFQAFVILYKKSTIDAMVADCVRHVYEYKIFKKKKVTYEDSSEDIADAETLCTENDSAISLLEDMLVGPGPKTKYDTRRDLVTELENAKSAQDKKIIVPLVKDVHAYLASLPRSGDEIVLTAASLIELKAKAKIYIDPATEGSLTRSPRNVVNAIRLRIPARIVRDGVMVADLPGVNDTNRTRGRNARRYLNTCSLFVVVHQLGRAGDNSGLMENLAKCIRKKKKIILVCTYADHFGDGSISEREMAIHTIKELVDTKITILKAVENLETSLANATANFFSTRSDAAMKEYSDASAALEAKKKELVRISNELFQVRVASRNERMEPLLQKKFKDLQREHTGYEGEDLEIIFVCNVEYGRIMAGSDAQMPAHLTGIPQFQKAVSEEPALERLRNTDIVASEDLPRDLLAYHLYCTKTVLERKQDVLYHVVKPMDLCVMEVRKCTRQLKQYHRETLHEVGLRNDSTWKTEAGRLSGKPNGWARYPYANYATFTKRNGEHKQPPSLGGLPENWNALIVKIMRKSMYRVFSKNSIPVGKDGQKLVESIVGLTSDLIELLQSE